MLKAAAKRNYLAISYDEKKLPRTAYPFKLAKHLFNKFVSGPGEFLDVGCGRGEFLDAFKQLGCQVTGIDISPAVEDLSSQYQVAQCDFEHDALPVADNTYDIVFSKSVVEHLHHPENMVDQCYRVLKPGGRAIFMCPSWVHTYWGPFYIDHTHVTPFTLPSLQQLLELSGFQIVEAQHFVQLPSTWKIPGVRILADLTSMVPIPFRPLMNSPLPEFINKWIRFSKEKMLLVVGEKPKS